MQKWPKKRSRFARGLQVTNVTNPNKADAGKDIYAYVPGTCCSFMN